MIIGICFDTPTRSRFRPPIRHTMPHETSGPCGLCYYLHCNSRMLEVLALSPDTRINIRFILWVSIDTSAQRGITLVPTAERPCFRRCRRGGEYWGNHITHRGSTFNVHRLTAPNWVKSGTFVYHARHRRIGRAPISGAINSASRGFRFVGAYAGALLDYPSLSLFLPGICLLEDYGAKPDSSSNMLLEALGGA